LVKHEFERAGGSLAVPGAVSFQFLRYGLILVAKSGITPDAMLEAAMRAGAEDVIERDDVFEIYTKWTDISVAKKQFSEAGYIIELTELIMRPTNAITPPEEVRQKNEVLIEALESLEDVQKVFTAME